MITLAILSEAQCLMQVEFQSMGRALRSDDDHLV